MLTDVKLAENPDFEKYKYSGYGFGFDESEALRYLIVVGFGKNVIIFGVGISSFV